MSDFASLALAPAILDRLKAAEFITPTPVQASTIPPALEGRDLLATAQTGTGKTLAFLLPAMQRLLNPASPSPPVPQDRQQATRRPHGDARGARILVLTPTRELAIQISTQYDQIRPRGLRPAALLVGGVSERPQLEALRQGAALVVATPGRLEDFLQRRLMRLDTIEMVVLDEVDRMLDIGFLPAIKRILALLPLQYQTLCFSATLAPEVEQLARATMRRPVRLAVGSAECRPAPTVELHAYEVAQTGKMDLLQTLLARESGRCLVFARTKRGTERLAKVLAREGFTAARIHGDRSQSQRSAALAGFQQGRFQVLVATDVAARGIHVDDVAHVINYDFPEAAEDFVHRVGRTGRAGERGLASTFVCSEQMHDLHRMERHLGIRLTRTHHAGAPAPTTAASPVVQPLPPRPQHRPMPGPRRPKARGSFRGRRFGRS